MKPDEQDSNFLGTKINPPGPAEWIGKSWRYRLSAWLQCLLNPKFLILTDAGDGVNSVSKDAEVIMGPNGYNVTLDLTGISGGGGGAALTVTDGTNTVSSVAQITFSGAVVSGSSPDATVTISVSAAIQQFQLAANSGVVDGGDYWWAKSWDGTTLGSTFVKIAKQYKQRCVNGPTSDSIGGVSYNYSYALDGSYPRYIRTTSISGGPFSGSTTTDYIEPQGLAGDIIYAIPFSTASPGTLAAVTLIEIGPMRDWITYPS